MTFSQLIPQESLANNLSKIGYDNPTEIQQESIELILEGKDIIASSSTGSGKTGAFVIPIISRILSSNGEESALILSPTRELAMQIRDAIHLIRGGDRINTALVFGGSNIDRQISFLRRDPNIVIATPGRLIDHMNRKTINLVDFNILVLDEFDRMLDMGFRDDISKIISQLPEKRQTLMFSATIRKSITDLAHLYLNNPIKIIIKHKQETHDHIKQDFVKLSMGEKYTKLLEEVKSRDESILVFVNTKRHADKLSYMLCNDGHQSEAIHGDLRQRQREKTISKFRNRKYKILIATDVVARGIDIPHIKHVINYDTPRTFEDYVHRIGRTGRNGVEGFSICFVTPSEGKFHNNILRRTDSDEAEYRPKRGGGYRQNNRNSGYRGRNNQNNRWDNNGGRKYGEQNRRVRNDSPRRHFTAKNT